VDKECFSDYLKLQEDPHCNFRLQNRWLSDLVSLKLQNCTLSCAIPSHILALLKSLEELEVRDSTTVEVLFYMNDSESMEIASRLRILTLEGLSKLTRVWENNKNGVLIFPNLQQVVVSDCKKLKTLFPSSQVKNFKSLKGIKINFCDELREIVEKEEDREEKFVLPCLEKLNLSLLSKLTCFYPETFALECPALNELSVSDCDELELFQCAHSTGEGTSVNRRPLISSLDVSAQQRIYTLSCFPFFCLSQFLISIEFDFALIVRSFQT